MEEKMGRWSRQLAMQLLCGTLLLMVEAGVHARMLLSPTMLEGSHEELGVISEVVHTRRHLQSAPYCVAIATADQTKLQEALDWACGPNGGAVECSAIQQGGSCYSPDTLQDHASYAFDYYYVKQNGASGSCDFGGLAMTSSSDPSSGSCVYPSIGGTPSPPSNSTLLSPPNNGTAFGSTPVSNNVAIRYAFYSLSGVSLLLVSLLAI